MCNCVFRIQCYLHFVNDHLLADFLHLFIYMICTLYIYVICTFKFQDLQELFSIPQQGFDVSLTQQQLDEEHDHHHIMYSMLLKFLCSILWPCMHFFSPFSSFVLQGRVSKSRNGVFGDVGYSRS